MESNNADEFKSLSIITYALMAGLTLFALVTYYLNTSGEPIGSGAFVSPTMDLLIVGGVGLTCLTMSRIVSGKLLGNFPQEERRDFQSAIGGYRSAIIVRLALLEGAGLLACVFALVTGNLNLLLITGFMVMMMWLGRPTETEFAEWRG